MRFTPPPGSARLDGRLVHFQYEPASYGGEVPAVHKRDGKLRWKDGQHEGEDGMESHIIPDANIITILRTANVGEYHILHVQEVDTAGRTDVSPVVFKVTIATNLPDEWVAVHTMPSTSCWQRWILQIQYRPNITVVVDIKSGTGLAKPVWHSLVEPMFSYLNIKPIVHFTSSPMTITDLGRGNIFHRANRGMDQAIVLLSGDGGVVDILNALVSNATLSKYKKPYITLLPLGTGNALANSAGVTGDRTFGLATMMRGKETPVPSFHAKFSKGAKMLTNEGQDEEEFETKDAEGHGIAHGAVVCSWALHAGLVADSDTTEYRKYGAERFKMAAKEALAAVDGTRPHPYQGKVSILQRGPRGWQAIARQQHSYVLATFCSHLEAGFNISPASQKLDGKLRLVHIGPVSGDEAMEIMSKAYQGGKHIDDDRVGYEEIEGLKIEFQESDAKWRRICIDGKIIRVEEGGWVEVVKAGKRMIDIIA